MPPMRTIAALILAAGLAAADSEYQSIDDRAMLGVNMTPTSSSAQAANGIDADTGVEVNSVYNGTAADRMGLQKGDVIVSVNGNQITSMTDIRNEVQLAGVGGQVDVVVLRDGKAINAGNTLSEWPKSIPYEPIDEAAEKRFRDWQSRRLDRSQQAVSALTKQVEDLERKMNQPKELPTGPVNPVQAMAMPAADALAFLPAWRLRVNISHDLPPVSSAADAQRSDPAWDARVLVGTPAPEIL